MIIFYRNILLPLENDFIFNRDELSDFDLLIKSLKTSLLNKNMELNPNLDYEMDIFIRNAQKYLDDRNIIEYVSLVISFSRKNMNSKATKRQILRYLSSIYPIMPYLSDEIYKELFNSRYSIINEGWLD